MNAFDLPASRLADAQTLVARFSRKAEKLGMSAPVLTVVREYTRFWLCNADGDAVSSASEVPPAVPAERKRWYVRSLDMVEITIAGERPVVAGWRFAAVIEATPVGNLLRKSPDFDGDLPLRFRDCTSECDHCQTVRNRAETFVVQHDESGEFKQVGRTCLQDFTGAADPSAWIAKYQFERSLADLAGWDDGDGGCGRAAAVILVLAFVAMVAAHVRIVGYMSAGKARESVMPVMSTGSEVFFGATDKEASKRDIYIDAVTDEDRQLAADAIAWVKSDAVGEVSDYIHNVRIYAGVEVVDSKGANTLASLVPTYRKHMGIRAEKATKLNEHLPGLAVKQRVRDMPLVLVAEHSFDTMYGTKWILRFEDSAGRCVVWKTTSPGSGYKTGDRVLLTGTVKDFGEYKGTNQTELTRCKVQPTQNSCEQ
jgi:hypothetical protein